MHRSFRSLRLRFALFALAAAVPVGCDSGPPTASVGGVVTINGRPLTGKVLLSFVGADRVPRTTETDELGKFTLDGLQPGEVTVTVSGAPAPESAPEGAARHTGGTRAAPRGKAAHGEVPPEYSDASRPLLRYTLAPGDNHLAVELKSPPRGGKAETQLPRKP
jgi:hypothetical protein